jgi:transcriptional regulator with XRE-family HTH domain
LSVEQGRDARTFGEWLRREREVRGIDLRVIADETKISKRFLEALEQGRLHILPGGVFPRSFLRQYSEYLGLDTARLLEQFGGLCAEPEPPLVRGFSAGRFVREHRANLTVAVIVVLVGAMTFMKVRAERGAADAFPVVKAASSARPFTRIAPREHVYAESPASPAASSGLRLALTARATSWVAVTVDGQSVVDRIFAAGEAQAFEGRAEILLSVGNAGGMSFTLNEQPGKSLGRTGEVRRNIQITQQSASAFVQDQSGALRLAQRD